MTCLIKSLFLRDYWTKSDGVFAEMQIISHNFITLKHIQINSQFRKILMLKVWLQFFGGTICIGSIIKYYAAEHGNYNQINLQSSPPPPFVVVVVVVCVCVCVCVFFFWGGGGNRGGGQVGNNHFPLWPIIAKIQDTKIITKILTFENVHSFFWYPLYDHLLIKMIW